MALKDWKKKQYNTKHILYEQKRSKDDIVGWNQTMVVRYFKPTWEVMISYEISDKYHTIKEFKTKSEALKYARNYMREHGKY